MDRIRSVAGLARWFWRIDRPLTITAAIMLLVLAGSIVGLVVDSRMITGMPAWMKPAKFAVSIAAYTLTLAWTFSYLPTWRKTRRILGWTTAGTLVLEIVVIVAQVIRGTTSHFNVGTPLDLTLWSAMGAAIVVQTIASLAVAAALWRQRFDDRVMGWALRLGLTIAIFGASVGGLMTSPTRAQIAEARTSHRMTVAGAHTVGAPDGGPGLPGTGWSVEHGDLRVPHFLGLHAFQALPILALLLRRVRIPEVAAVRLMITIAISYATLGGILIWQALRGQSVTDPDLTTVTVLGIWALVASFAVWLVSNKRHAIHASVAY
jgi:hypothetical protein